MVSVNWTNVTTAKEFLQTPNVASGGYFWVGMLFMLYVIIFISSLSFGFEVALLSSSFVAFLIGLILVYADLVAWYYVAMLLGVLVITSLLVMYSKKD